MDVEADDMVDIMREWIEEEEFVGYRLLRLICNFYTCLDFRAWIESDGCFAERNCCCCDFRSVLPTFRLRPLLADVAEIGFVDKNFDGP